MSEELRLERRGRVYHVHAIIASAIRYSYSGRRSREISVSLHTSDKRQARILCQRMSAQLEEGVPCETRLLIAAAPHHAHAPHARRRTPDDVAPLQSFFNPFGGVKVRGLHKRGFRRAYGIRYRVCKISSLQIILHSPVYTEGVRPLGEAGEAAFCYRYWASHPHRTFRAVRVLLLISEKAEARYAASVETLNLAATDLTNAVVADWVARLTLT